MDWDEPIQRKRRLEPANLEVLGVAELGEYVTELEAEIARAKAAIDAKKNVRAGADALFKR